MPPPFQKVVSSWQYLRQVASKNMTSETTSPFTTSPEQQFMLDVTRKKATSSSSPPRQDLSLDTSSATSFKDALMHDMDVIEPTAFSIHEET